jgi:hypothetical protein
MFGHPVHDGLPGGTARLGEGDGDRLALVAIAATVALVPLLEPHGPANLSPVDPVIGVAIIASLLWARSPGRPLRFPYAVGVGILIAAGALGAMAGPVPAGGFMSLLQDIWLLIWCAAIVNVARTAHAVGVLLKTWAWSSIVWSCALLAGVATGTSALTGVTERNGGRISMTLGDPNFAANYFVVSIMVIWAGQYPRSRVVRILAYATLLWCWALAGSNSGIISLSAGMLVIGLSAVWRRWGLVPMVAAGMCLAVVVVFLAASVRVSDIQRDAKASRYRFVRDWIGRSDQSTGDRERLLHEGIALYFSGGPLGEGPTSTKVRLASDQAPYVKEAHNDYLAAITERGLLGAVGLIVLVSSVLVRTASIVVQPLSPGFAEEVRRPAALGGAVVGVLLTGATYELLHVRHVWALFALVATVYLWGRE